MSAEPFDPELVAWALDEARERVRRGGAWLLGPVGALARAVLMLDADRAKEADARKREIRELQEQRDAAWTELELRAGASR